MKTPKKNALLPVLAAVLLTILTAGLLSACGGEGKESTAPPSGTSSAESGSEQPSLEEMEAGLDVWRAIADLHFPENYFAEYDISYTAGGYTFAEALRLIKAEGRWWAAIDREDVTVQVYSCDGGKEYAVTDCVSGVTAWYHSEDGFTPEVCLGIPAASEVSSVLKTFLEDGAAESRNGTVTRVQTGMLSSSTRNVADIIFYYAGENTRDEYLIDLDTGMIVIAENYRNNELYASLSVSHYLDNSTVDIGEIFDIYVAIQ